MKQRLNGIAHIALSFGLLISSGCASESEETEAPPKTEQTLQACEEHCEVLAAGDGCGDAELETCLAGCEAIDLSGCEDAAEASWTCGANDAYVCDGGLPYTQSQACVDVHIEFALCVQDNAGA